MNAKTARKEKRRQRKLIRLAAKRQKFEIRREKELSKNRLRKYVICGVFVGAHLLIAAFCLASILPLYADYTYATDKNNLKLPPITEPSFVEITITYKTKRPERLRMTNKDILMTNIDITDDFKNKTITISFDTNVISDEYVLSLSPGDNIELIYEVILHPSKKYIIHDINYYTDQYNDLWVYFNTAYPRIDNDMYCLIYLTDTRSTPFIMQMNITQFKDYDINISELMRAQNIIPKNTSTVEVKIGIDQNMTENFVPSVYKRIKLNELPAYDENIYHEFNLNATLDYLSRIH